ncbi:hypothetical protein [Embleya sp. MST-111070]|uniref:hypothetical protein n=1 Tax=Embleya sp. MST-111070 TaxID=3398231 RepID=UPI003F741E9B
MDRERCSTSEHITLTLGREKELASGPVRWTEVVRDSLYGIVVTVLVALGIFVLFNPLPVGGFLGLVLVLEVVALVWRLGSGHRFGCAAKLATPTVFRVYDYVFQALELAVLTRHFVVVGSAATRRSRSFGVDNSSGGSVASTS